MRGAKALHTEETKHFNRLWFFRDAGRKGCGEDKYQEMLEQDSHLATDLDTFELGRLSGRLEALRWMMGEEWGFLDT